MARFYATYAHGDGNFELRAKTLAGAKREATQIASFYSGSYTVFEIIDGVEVDISIRRLVTSGSTWHFDKWDNI